MGKRVGKRRGNVIAQAGAIFLAAGFGCTSPRPVPPAAFDLHAESGSGRFCPDTPTERWDDSREFQLSFFHQRTWMVESPAAKEVSFQRRFAEDDSVWGELRIPALSERQVIRLMPGSPVLISEPFDTVEMALEGRLNEGGASESPVLDGVVRLSLEDFEGRIHAVSLGPIPADPVLRQRHLGPTFLADASFPFHLRSVEIETETPVPFTLRIGDAAFYPQCRMPLSDRFLSCDRSLPKRTARIVDALTAGVDGLDRESIGFGGTEPGWAQRLRTDESGRFVFEADARTHTVSYRLDPRGEGSVTLLWNGRPVAVWPGVRLERDDGSRLSTPARMYRSGPLEVTLEYSPELQAHVSLEGYSLSLRLRGGRRIALCEAEPVSPPFRPMAIPFFNDLPESVHAVYTGGAPDLFFASLVFDPHVSRASRPVPNGMAYDPATDGRRPVFREQLFLTLSERLASVLPEPPRFKTGSTPGVYPEHRIWSDAPREEADIKRPDVVGFGRPPERLQSLLDGDDIRPGLPGWTRDALLRDPDGNWIEGVESGSYRKKPAWRLAEALFCREDRLGESQPGTFYYVPLSQTFPGALTDYDARTDMPGSFGKGYRALAQRFRDIGESTGAVLIGCDTQVWWYADSVGGWLVSEDRGRRLFRQPFLPEMSQRLLRPLGVGIGLGPADRLLEQAAEGMTPEAALNRYLATHLAYGLVLRLPLELIKYGSAARLLELAGAVQSARAGHRLDRIGYYEKGRIRTLAEALSSGDVKALDRLYIRYANGLELWINGSAELDWLVRAGGVARILPPSGWLALGDGIQAFVARKEGRIAYVAQTPDRIFWDGAGHDNGYGGIAGPGAYTVFPADRDAAELIVVDHTGAGYFRIDPERFGLPDAVLAHAVDAETGDVIPDIRIQHHETEIEVRGDPRPARYTFEHPAKPLASPVRACQAVAQSAKGGQPTLLGTK